MPIVNKPYDMICDLCTSKLGELNEAERSNQQKAMESDDYRPALLLEYNEETLKLDFLCPNCNAHIEHKVLPLLKRISRPRQPVGKKREAK